MSKKEAKQIRQLCQLAITDFLENERFTSKDIEGVSHTYLEIPPRIFAMHLTKLMDDMGMFE